MSDGDDVFGIFAANGLMELAWGIAAAVLIVLALLPRVGGGRRDERRADDRFLREREARPARARSGASTMRER